VWNTLITTGTKNRGRPVNITDLNMNEYFPNKLSNIFFIIAAFIFLLLIIGTFIWGTGKPPPDHVGIEAWSKWQIASLALGYIGFFSTSGGLITQYILKRKKDRERTDIKIK